MTLVHLDRHSARRTNCAFFVKISGVAHAGNPAARISAVISRFLSAFLADGLNDPRRQFAETLIDVLATRDVPIIVYSAYEQTRLRELAANFPDLSAPLNAAIARLRDLLPIVRSAVYLPEFRFSNSIKSVARTSATVTCKASLMG